MEGAAAAMPSTARTWSTSDAGIMPLWASPSASMRWLLRTWASMPRLASEKKSTNDARMVSPSTRVPARKATPSTTATVVDTSRRLRAHTPFRVIWSMSASDRLDAVEHGVGGRSDQPVDDATVGQEQDAVGPRRRVGVVGHHHDRLAHLVHRV